MSVIKIARRGLILGATVGTLALLAGQGQAADKTLKIGVLGVMSGPAASWGLVNKYCAEATAAMYNEQGGVKIGDDTYQIEVIAIDDKNDPKLAVSGAERLIQQEGIRYIIGPNIDTTATSMAPVGQEGGALNFPYAFSKSLYEGENSNSVLGMIASYQAGPIIYKYLMENEGVQTVSFIARNESDSLNQRTEGVAAAEALGLKVIGADATYEGGTVDFFPVMTNVVGDSPDLIVLSGVAPADAPLLLKTARELGFAGLISTETAQDIKILNEVAGSAAEGFISVGGASTPEIESDYMKAFKDKYVDVAGEWNDEAGTKVYALEIILRTMQANPAAVDDIGTFKATMVDFAEPNPLMDVEGAQLQYVGTQYFGQKHQIGVPLVVNQVQDGEFKTLFVGSVE